MAYWIDESDPGRLLSNSRQIPFWADAIADIDNLPTSSTPGVQQGNDTVSCQPIGRGSTCTCIENSSLYVLNSNDEWKKL